MLLNGRSEGVPRHAEPISPGAVLPGLVDQALTDVENHRTDHAASVIPAAIAASFHV